MKNTPGVRIGSEFWVHDRRRTAIAIVLASVGIGLFCHTARAQCLSLDYAPTARTVGTAVADIASADIDRDGDLDVLTADSNASVIHVLVNNGTLGFVEHMIDPGVSPMAIAFADVDSDGDLDLLVGFSSGMRWLRNDGLGNFAIASTFTFPARDANPIGIVMADVNEDGHLDAVLGLNGATGFEPATFSLGNDPDRAVKQLVSACLVTTLSAT